MTCTRCGGPQRDGLVRLRWPITAALLLVGLGLAYGLGGALLHDLIEGNQRSLLPLRKAYVPGAVLLLAVAAAVTRWRRPVCDRCPARGLWVPLPGRADALLSTRRRALRALGAGGATVAAAAGGLGAAVVRNRQWVPVFEDFFQARVEGVARHARPEWRQATIKSYRRLGRTNEHVSDISLGSSRINNLDVALAALDRGINYFDTAPDYADTSSERILGQALKGRRDKVFLATKFCVADGHLPNDTPVPAVMAAVEASLTRLQTDYVDLVHIHSCDRVDRLMAPNIHEAFDRLKEQGKVRFLGVSTHTPNLEEVAHAAIDSGRFDVMMLAYHFGMWPSFAHILEKARQHDVGIVAMKTLKGAMHTNLAQFRDEATVYSQAAFRWVLSNPNVSCLVVSFYLPQHVDEYIYASGMPPTAADVGLLERYDQLTRGDYCQPHCGVCLDSCPEQLAINDILRYRMYFRDYGWEKEGMQRYARLERNATRCVTCAAPCTGTCPIGVPIRAKMLDAHRLLRFVA